MSSRRPPKPTTNTRRLVICPDSDIRGSRRLGDAPAGQEACVTAQGILLPLSLDLHFGPLEFTGLLFSVAVVAGFLGSLTGLGGGVVMTPALTLLFGVDLRYAIGATLVSVIATSSGAASAYVREGYTNVRIGMFLEVATTFG